MNREAVVRVSAVASLAALALAVTATVFGHLGLGPGFNPLALTISDYALSDRGAAIEIAMVALSGGTLALVAGLVAARAPVRGTPTALFAVWCLGLIVSAAVPTDEIGATAMTASGYVHRYASVAAFVALPIAATILAGRFAPTRDWSGLSSGLRWLSAGVGAGLLVLLYVAFPGGRVLIGLVERSLVMVEIVMLLALATRLLRVGLASAAARRAAANRTVAARRAAANRTVAAGRAAENRAVAARRAAANRAASRRAVARSAVAAGRATAHRPAVGSMLPVSPIGRPERGVTVVAA